MNIDPPDTSTKETFALDETVVLDASRKWSQRDSDSNPIAFRQGSFWYQRGRTIYNIGDADRATNTLRGIQILELDAKGRLLRSIDAERATVESDDQWVFDAPLVRVFDPELREAPPTVVRHEGETRLSLADQTGLALMNADIATLSVAQLHELIGGRARLSPWSADRESGRTRGPAAAPSSCAPSA